VTIRHHPDDAMLAAFAAGTLDLGQQVAVATHLHACAQCRRWVQAMQEVGGAMLDSLPPSPMHAEALARVDARLTTVSEASPHRHSSSLVPEAEAPGVPEFVRRYRFGQWKRVAPRVHLRPIVLPEESETRVFLLRSGPGTRMLEHSHSGIELTCVLSGAFSHEGGRFGPGDFDYGDDAVEHQPLVEAGEDCLCLVAMTGDLKLRGLLGKLLQPFVRI
jgi:putative transcriptional regulator